MWDRQFDALSMHHSREKCPSQKVAVVGTGMAGLVTAWLLHNDRQQRYEVKLIEAGPKTSLDSASISIVDPETSQVERVDVPMRAFTEGYYSNLKAMYDHLGVRYRVQPFRFAFARVAGSAESKKEDAYFVHASNNHELPPQRPKSMSLVSYLYELVVALTCYVWFGIACLVMPVRVSGDGLSENFDAYLRRIRLPRYFVKFYLLPLMSAVTTCTHEALLDFPAKDVVDYKRCITSGRQLVVSEGVQAVQQKLLEDLTVSHHSHVRCIEKTSTGLSVQWTQGGLIGETREEMFDKVVLAVPPNIVATIWKPLQETLSRIPTTDVETIVHHDRSTITRLNDFQSHRPWLRLSSDAAKTQLIYLRTSDDRVTNTEATHVQESGAMVTSCPLQPCKPSSLVSKSKFTRVLRTPKSRNIVNKIFELNATPLDRQNTTHWKNGDGGVYLVGAWCWDGMVLLEGCVVSAMRTARSLGVETPWLRYGS